MPTCTSTFHSSTKRGFCSKCGGAWNAVEAAWHEDPNNPHPVGDCGDLCCDICNRGTDK